MSIFIARQGTMAAGLEDVTPSAITAQVVVSRAASFSWPDASWSAFSYDTEDLDASGYFTLASPSRVTVPSSLGGWHYFTLRFTGNGSNALCQVVFSVFNSSDVSQRDYYGPWGKGQAQGSIAVLMKLNDGDYVTTVGFAGESGRSWSSARLEVIRFV